MSIPREVCHPFQRKPATDFSDSCHPLSQRFGEENLRGITHGILSFFNRLRKPEYQPLAPIPQACGGDKAKTKAAYRFLSNKNVDLDTLLAPHIEAMAKRMEAHPVVLVAQDTTSINYNTHKATEGLGPINTHADGAQGLKLHDTIAFYPCR